jgi:hypothetical protein
LEEKESRSKGEGRGKKEKLPPSLARTWGSSLVQAHRVTWQTVF